MRAAKLLLPVAVDRLYQWTVSGVGPHRKEMFRFSSPMPTTASTSPLWLGPEN